MVAENTERVHTTFHSDFAIAEHFGVSAVMDTYERCVKQWRHDYRYMTELVMALNERCWIFWHVSNGEMEAPEMYTRNDRKYARELGPVYSDLYHRAAGWCEENLKGDEYEYYFRITD